MGGERRHPRARPPLAPGSGSPGTTTITENYLLEEGEVQIELAGTAAGTQHDKVIVNGELDIGGLAELNVSLIDGFIPTAGDRFDIFDFGSLTGAFDMVHLPWLGLGLAWDQSQLYTDGILAVLPAEGLEQALVVGLAAGTDVVHDGQLKDLAFL